MNRCLPAILGVAIALGCTARKGDVVASDVLPAAWSFDEAQFLKAFDAAQEAFQNEPTQSNLTKARFEYGSSDFGTCLRTLRTAYKFEPDNLKRKKVIKPLVDAMVARVMIFQRERQEAADRAAKMAP